MRSVLAIGHHVGLAVAETAATRSISRGRSLVILGMTMLAIMAVLWLASR
jgi:hypothetical protein